MARSKLHYFLIPGLLSTILSVMTSSLAADVEEAPMGEAVERHLTDDTPFMQWVQDPDQFNDNRGDRLEVREKLVDEYKTIKLTGLVPPIHFESGVANIPDSTVQSLGEILDSMKERLNVRLHLVGHADNQPLSSRLQAIYGDNMGLSRERAGEVAEYIQAALSLPAESISWDWKGDTEPLASNDTAQGRALNRRVEVEVWYDEVEEKVSEEEFVVADEITRVKVCRMETVCKLRYVDGHAKRARIRNLVVPLRYGTDNIDVTTNFVEAIDRALVNMTDKQNVVVKFVGFTDGTPLTPRMERIYGDHVGLSRARARRVALAVQDSLGLPTSRIQSDGKGTAQPLASNATASGRALNRRIEVEFWYDDPLQDLPDEPQLCPEAAGADLVSRVYDPPWGNIADIEFTDGHPVIPTGYASDLERAMNDIAGKKNVRLRFVGYTRNERLSRRTAAVYGDDIGLSASRARRAMELIAEEMELDASQIEFEGRGYVQSDDVVNAGFTQEGSSHVEVEVVYDDLAVLDDYEGVDITRLTREITPENPLGLNLMRITVDGIPIDDPKRSSSDIQRCTDVAMEDADIRFGFDNLRSSPRLSVSATPSQVVTDRNEVNPVYFRMYTNYGHFIDHSEVRIFEAGQSLRSTPLQVIEISPDETVAWQPSPSTSLAPGKELVYVLRAYDNEGKFDETGPQRLWMVNQATESHESEPGADLLATWGENTLSVHNIALGSGSVNVRGEGIPDGKQVWVAGREVPLGPGRSFVAEEILPDGVHTVEVALVDDTGSGESYLRDLEFEENDWFYVGMADLTLAENSTTGPVDMLQGANATYDHDSNADGRLAFFVNGKFGNHWKLTASADTREGPVEDLFNNFMDKSPEALFRRIDPDYYYPTFGDDSTVMEAAPTSGKFFVRLSKDKNYGQWGNFMVGYMNNELAQVDRGLYGANFHYEAGTTTTFGERRFAIDGYAAEPGTLGSREEFRGTGGSLYFLQRQDIANGSERVRIEIRDKASGLVTGVVPLTPTLDYDIDYLQGRILLAQPLASTADDNLLVRSNAIEGDEAYLVVRYEYSPGFEELDTLSGGGQMHYWFGDHVKLGLVASSNEEDSGDSSLAGVDLTLRHSAGSWVKVQQANSEGLVSLSTVSADGGFQFGSYDPLAFGAADASANRMDISVATNDFTRLVDGKLTLYIQDVEAGYSAPGLATLRDTKTYGGRLDMPVGERLSLGAKVDQQEQDQGLKTSTSELNLGYDLTQRWNVQAGVRRDGRDDRSPVIVATQETGDRTDAVVQVGYDPRTTWNSYLFVQETLTTTGSRRDNSRIGVGGKYLISDKLELNTEFSDGDLGMGGRVGTNYAHSENTSLYLNYALENERTDNVTRSVRGSQGNLTAGLKSRLGDSTSVFLEERYQHNKAMTGLTHATGITFAPTERWNLGVNTDMGTLIDLQTGAETERIAGGIQLGFHFDTLQFASAIEYRNDDSEQLDLTRTERTTWLLRNNFKYQHNAGSRLVGKLNHSTSESSLGTFYDGGFTEAVLGYAWRPVASDRLNTMVKYTYFYNVPTTDQISLQNIATEFIQKSHIAAIDVTWDITRRLTLGAKYAYRLGQVSIDRENSDFLDNNAHLYIVRTDYDIGANWEVLAEARMLDMTDFNETRSGALVTVSRYLGDHVKLGAGYNFTDFSDDLTDLSYTHHGFFLNITGSM